MINNYTIKNEFEEYKTVSKFHARLQKLINELNKRDIPEEVSVKINEKISLLDSFEGSKGKYVRQLDRTFTFIQQTIKKKLGLVTKGFYTAIWLSIGMAGIGIPIGVAWYSVTQSPAFIAIGLPIGMAVGIVIGIIMDSKAKQAGKQITVE